MTDKDSLSFKAQEFLNSCNRVWWKIKSIKEWITNPFNKIKLWTQETHANPKPVPKDNQDY